jgi:hypothetical protein
MFYCHGRWEGVVEEDAGEREIREKKELKNKKQKNASCCDTSFASMS